MTKHRLTLTATERTKLLAKIQKGKAAAKLIQKAQVLLASDEAIERQSQTTIAAMYHRSTRSVERIRKEFCEQGMGLFDPKPRQPRADKKLTGEVEAHLIAIACSEPPAGESRWKLQAIADRLVELQVNIVVHHESSLRMTIRRAFSAFRYAQYDFVSTVCCHNGLIFQYSHP